MKCNKLMQLSKTTLSRKNLSWLVQWTSILIVSQNFNSISSMKEYWTDNYVYTAITILALTKLGPQKINIPNYLLLIQSDQIKQEILIINNKRASRKGDIPFSILKEALDTYLPILAKVINSLIEQNEFPKELKLPDVLPIYKSIPF